MTVSSQEYGPLLPGRPGNLAMADCPSREILNHLTNRWGSLVLIALLQGTHRFSLLVRRIEGVSEKMLAQTLQALEADGFVLRTVFPTIPPKVEYSLTPMGVEVAAHVKRLTDWVQKSVPKVMKARQRVKAKKPVVAL